MADEVSEPLSLLNSSRTHGQCLCGSVSFSLTESRSHFDACHCKMCMKWGGGPALTVDVGSQISWLGQEFIGVYASSSWAERGLCKRCGTHLFFQLRDSDFCNVPLGLFEDLKGWKFKTQIYTDQKPSFYSFSNETECLTEEEVLAHFSGL